MRAFLYVLLASPILLAQTPTCSITVTETVGASVIPLTVPITPCPTSSVNAIGRAGVQGPPGQPGPAGTFSTAGYTFSGNTRRLITKNGSSINTHLAVWDVFGNLIDGGAVPGGGGGSGTVSSVSCTVPGASWMTCAVVNPTTFPAISIAFASGQTSHQVIGTATGATFGPITLAAADLPFTYSGNTSKLVTASGSFTLGHVLVADASGNAVDGGGGGGGGSVLSVACSVTGASWMTCSVASPTTDAAISIAFASGQTAHKVIGTGAGASFGPVTLATGDLPFTYSGNTTKLVTASGSFTSGHPLVADASGNAVDGGANYISASGALTLDQLVFGAGGKTVAVGDLTGDITTSGGKATTLATVNSGPGTCGDSTHVCQVTVNGKGLQTSQTEIAISGAGGTSLPGQDGDDFLVTKTSSSVLTINPGSQGLGGFNYYSVGQCVFTITGGTAAGTTYLYMTDSGQEILLYPSADTITATGTNCAVSAAASPAPPQNVFIRAIGIITLSSGTPATWNAITQAPSLQSGFFPSCTSDLTCTPSNGTVLMGVGPNVTTNGGANTMTGDFDMSGVHSWTPPAFTLANGSWGASGPPYPAYAAIDLNFNGFPAASTASNNRLVHGFRSRAFQPAGAVGGIAVGGGFYTQSNRTGGGAEIAGFFLSTTGSANTQSFGLNSNCSDGPFKNATDAGFNGGFAAFICAAGEFDSTIGNAGTINDIGLAAYYLPGSLYQGLGASYSYNAGKPANTLNNPVFTGAGLDDLTLTAGASYTGNTSVTYAFKLISNGAPDTFNYTPFNTPTGADLVIGAANSISAVGHYFTLGEVGGTVRVQITSGTGCTPANYTIGSVAGGVATLTGSPGTIASTCTYTLWYATGVNASTGAIDVLLPADASPSAFLQGAAIRTLATSYGLQVKFGATTGHTIGDIWRVTVTGVPPRHVGYNGTAGAADQFISIPPVFDGVNMPSMPLIFRSKNASNATVSNQITVQPTATGTVTRVTTTDGMQFPGEVQISFGGTTVRKTCNSTNAGKIYYSGHTAGVKDEVSVCAADAADAYAWRAIY